MEAIQISNVNKYYKRKNKDDFYALRNLSLNVKKGQVFCLLGPNGSGKTTTINLINGLNRPSNGLVRIMNLDSMKDIKSIRKILGVVTQETALYNDLTAKENLLFHAQYYGVDKKIWTTQINNMLNLVGLKERENDRVGTFSGGMQRRLSLARSLLTSPEIILLDEPTLGVDVHSRNEIWKRIKELTHEGKTIFLTTNYMEEAEELSDQITIIDKGEKIISGSLEELKNKLSSNIILLSFDNEKTTKKIDDYLKKQFPTKCKNNNIYIEINEKKLFYSVLNYLGKNIELANNFKIMEPTLNDIFLHYTGRDLRD